MRKCGTMTRRGRANEGSKGDNDNGGGPLHCAFSGLQCVAPIRGGFSTGGAVDPHEASIFIFQLVAVCVMPLLPFAAARFTSFLLKAVCVLLAVALLANNFLAALDSSSAVRDGATGAARGTLARAQALTAQIKALQAKRAEVPKHAFTSAEAVSAAQTAVRNAEKAREDACNWSASKACRERSEAIDTANAALARITEQRELTAHVPTASRLSSPRRRRKWPLWVPFLAMLTQLPIALCTCYHGLPHRLQTRARP